MVVSFGHHFFPSKSQRGLHDGWIQFMGDTYVSDSNSDARSTGLQHLRFEHGTVGVHTRAAASLTLVRRRHVNIIHALLCALYSFLHILESLRLGPHHNRVKKVKNRSRYSRLTLYLFRQKSNPR